ncbi:hypothetical protein NE848_06190 [Gramella jeungdoensis]|uniref:Transposase n=1 Tax=Gramella jeungdoensis TaxID=708091 RepID=A0ABT0Z052_9FLAO|nr:hypothetical protein [Gramella jeungdoensis]MCM8568959.1 hypothetical protein [Gramella jeungdoensis]
MKSRGECMRLHEKKRTIEYLEKLRVMNYKSAFIYKIAFDKEDRLILKNFYRKLHQQKQKFLKDIDEKIEQVKIEISPIKDPKLLAFYKRQRCELSQLYLKYKMKHTYARAYKREVKSFKKYHKYLSRINHARVREVLLAHKHKVKTNLSEMNNTGVMKFPVG